MKRTVKVRTRNFSADPLRGAIDTDKRAVVRLGSLTPTSNVFPKAVVNKKPIVEINTIDAIQNSRSKLRMKSCFATLKVPQSEWYEARGNNTAQMRDVDPTHNYDGHPADSIIMPDKLPYPLVVKRVFGFQGRGMELLEDQKQLEAWLAKHSNTEGWYFEKFYNYAREYRLHVANGVGVFLSWRKLRTKEAKERWFFNSINSNWVGEEHELFDRPKCWKAMEEAAVNALKSTGLDIGAVDIRVQSNKHTDPKFIVCEINSAPALGEVGVEKYKSVIKDLINKKNE